MLIKIKTIFLVFVCIISGFATQSFAAEKKDINTDNLRYQKAFNYHFSQFQKNKKDGKAIYNLAVLSYKLKKYSQAKTYFLQLLPFQAYHLVAKYNLGLVANKSGDTNEALSWFRKINAHTHPLNESDKVSLNIKKLAKIQIQKLQAGKAGSLTTLTQATDIEGYVFAYYGNEDKYIDSAGAVTEGDDFLNLYGLLTFNLDEVIMPGVHWRLNYYAKDYQTRTEYDYHILGTDVGKSFKQGSWRHYIRLGFDKSTYGGENYQSISKLDMKFLYKLPHKQEVSTRLRFDEITSDNALYDAYEGQRQRIDLRYDWKFDQEKLRVDLGYDNSDLADSISTITSNVLHSYSPLRQKLQLSWFHKFNGNWKTRLRYEWRDSRYADYSTVDNLIRDDTRVASSIRLKYHLKKSWWLVSEFKYTDNESNISRYRYSRNRIRIGVSGSF